MAWLGKLGSPLKRERGNMAGTTINFLNKWQSAIYFGILTAYVFLASLGTFEFNVDFIRYVIVYEILFLLIVVNITERSKIELLGNLNKREESLLSIIALLFFLLVYKINIFSLNALFSFIFILPHVAITYMNIKNGGRVSLRLPELFMWVGVICAYLLAIELVHPTPKGKEPDDISTLFSLPLLLVLFYPFFVGIPNLMSYFKIENSKAVGFVAVAGVLFLMFLLIISSEFTKIEGAEKGMILMSIAGFYLATVMSIPNKESITHT